MDRTTERLRDGSRDRLTELGFFPAQAARTALIQRLAPLHAVDSESDLHLSNLYARTIPGGRVYVFDLEDHRPGGAVTRLGEGIVGVVDANLRLPHFALRPHGDGLRSGRVPGLSLDPDFDRRFAVVAHDEAAVRSFLNDERRGNLSTLEGRYEIRAGGDTFTLRRLGSVEDAGVEMLLRAADSLDAWFLVLPAEPYSGKDVLPRR